MFSYKRGIILVVNQTTLDLYKNIPHDTCIALANAIGFEATGIGNLSTVSACVLK